jgi:sodium/proline symporter
VFESGIATAFTPAILCSLFWDKTTKNGAIAGMISGFITTVVWVLLFKERFFDLYEMIPGFVVGFSVVIGVSLIGRPPEGAAEEMAMISAETRKEL